jgi:hypothetical protein
LNWRVIKVFYVQEEDDDLYHTKSMSIITEVYPFLSHEEKVKLLFIGFEYNNIKTLSNVKLFHQNLLLEDIDSEICFEENCPKDDEEERERISASMVVVEKEINNRTAKMIEELINLFSNHFDNVRYLDSQDLKVMVSQS